MKHSLFSCRQRNGFTLIELIIYIGITALVVVSLTRVMITVFETRNHTTTGTELQQNLRFIMSKMTTVIISSQQFDWGNSIIDTSSGALTLIQDDIHTSFVLTDGTIHIVHEDDISVPLHGSGIVIEQLVFNNVSAPSGPETVHIFLQGKHANLNQDEKIMTLETSITLRQ